jgi:hypothetical protein
MQRVLVTMMLLILAPQVHGAVTASPGYAVRFIEAPGTLVGGVARRGSAILVGQGSFGGGTESVVRLDGATATTIATGFNALSGFDLDAAGTLYVTDNCGECGGATTGDTVFAIPDALTRTTPVTALGAEVVPAGTIPAAADVLVLAGGTLLVSDAAGPGAGRVVQVQGGATTDLVTGLGYAGGLALASGPTLLVGDVDGSFTGSVGRYDLTGASLAPLASGLPGAFAQALDADGQLLVTGEFSFDCSAGRLLAIAPDGDVTTRATGFCFSADVFFDAARNEALVIDGGASGAAAKQVVAICRDIDDDDVCDVDDVCPAVADPGQADADGDGIGDACDACGGGAAIVKGNLVLGKLDPPSGDDTLSLKGALTLASAPALDPLATGVRVIVAGTTGVVLDAALPPGAFDKGAGEGWKERNGKFKWKSRVGVQGLRKAVIALSSRVPGLVSFVVAGKNAAYDAGLSHLPLHATLVVGSSVGECGDATFADGCVHKARAGKVQCR